MNNEYKIKTMSSLFKKSFPEATTKQISKVSDLLEYAYLTGVLDGMIKISDIDNGVICPRCKSTKVNLYDIESIRDFGMCPLCDHVLVES